MDSQSDIPKRKPLVTVEFQTEVDVATGNREKRMFVKMYFDARDSGLLAALPDELWKTLCCLATYMDEDGNCYPSQALLGEALGISRQHINNRIKRLLAFRFRGEPILTMTKNRESKRGGSRWANNGYRLRTITGLAMFDEGDNDAAIGAQRDADQSSMSPKGDTQLPSSMSPYRVTQRPGSMSPSVSPCMSPMGDTNQIERDRTKTLNVNGFKKFPSETQTANNSLPAAEEIRVGSLVLEMLDVCRDRHSRGFYHLVAQKVPEDLIRAALSETTYQDRMGRITKSCGAFFTDQLRRLAMERGIEIGLKLPRRNAKPTAG
jgi:helix-turn-helix protein